MIGCHSCVFSEEKLTKAGAIGPLFERFAATLRQSGYIAMAGQIVDASLTAAPRQRNTQDEKKASKDGRIPDAWKDKPAKPPEGSRGALDSQIHQGQAARGWLDAARRCGDSGLRDPNHISLDRGFGFIRKWSRKWSATDAAAYEGRRLRDGLLDKTNTASSVWDTAYRSAATEEFMERNGFVSHVHRKRPQGRPMPEAIRRANNAKSKIRSRVEHVFAEPKDRMGLFIQTIGTARAKTKTGLASLVSNIKRLLFLRRLAAA